MLVVKEDVEVACAHYQSVGLNSSAGTMSSLNGTWEVLGNQGSRENLLE